MFETILFWILFSVIVVANLRDWLDDRKSDAENRDRALETKEL